ncbi:MAG: 2,3,4,5-tetrahydropyridine-2,6-dicarboxylate N-succinyltransferase [Acidobacteriota bacterium]|nr:MAG: 2,3,4,5-tetrahydropyridine-2,6-dicarboxylate N-succinyltransferase [Acidobacteriota bacterium]
MGAGEGLRERIERLAAQPEPPAAEVREAVLALLDALERGDVRAASPADDGWTVHPWVKTGILLGFRAGDVVPLPPAGPLEFRDKEFFPPRTLATLERVRVVPGGSAIRRGAYVGPGTVLMPPCYVNVGAWVGEGSMIDSHALVGSCAQLGAGIHLSAGAQIGGVLEPPGAMPVIVEDGAFVGALSAVLEGVQVGRRAVIGAGVVLTASTPLYDLTRHRRVLPGADGVLRIPPGAVVVAGTRAPADPWARSEGLATAAALIVKQRDERTDARAALEDALR